MSQQHNGRSLGHQARKRFGQNFLQDTGIISRIVRAVRPSGHDRLVEIGPGMGAITEQLLAQNEGALDVIELDRDLIPGLRVKFFNYPDFKIHEADALKFDFSQLKTDERPLRIVGNLPYNISTPLIFHLLAQSCVADMHFMLQKEVVHRLAAHPGGGEWGRLSVMAQYFCQVECLFEVPPECFIPRPKVDSAIVRLTPYETPPYPADDLKMLDDTVRRSFAQRRKTLRNNLKGLVEADDLQRLEIDPQRRPETLSLEEFVRISNWRSQE